MSVSPVQSSSSLSARGDFSGGEVAEGWTRDMSVRRR